MFLKFSSDFVHGLLSYHVYGEIKEGDFLIDNNLNKIINKLKPENQNILTNNWEIIKLFTIEKVYQNLFREDSSLNNTIQGIICNEYVPQLSKSYEVTEYCYKMALNKKCTLSFTGYSNGAWLSEYSIYFCEKYIKPMHKRDFDVEFKAFFFESPGILRDESDLNSNLISLEKEFHLRDINIVNYLISPNLMNSCNKHIGKVYRLFIKNKDQENKNSKEFFVKIRNKVKLLGKLLSDTMEKSRFIFNGLYYTFDHSFLRFILEECFENEKPINFCQMKNWPLIEIDFDKN
ncbi:unnamed protein product [Brachionus calyciflorus]|uniref:Uncharacterized protein n=1 Tax=Brachionus calyciflorus TaxID=104777 RepID=A0A813YI55_9BILA|nr:unnamed protein product [Brachionus calyciflorus]